jgi:type II secretion system protein G
MNKNKGFTLIELLIVVAIIAILAAIAIPNFLQAQVRAKVSRARAEMRTLATGLESYYVDENMYPAFYWSGVGVINPNSKRLQPLTTPVSYIASVPKPDPFGNDKFDPVEYDSYDYIDEAAFVNLRNSQGIDPRNQWGGHTWGRAWRLSSLGPDRFQTYASNIFAGAEYPAAGYPAYYDPTNGTVSNGDILRFGGEGKLSYGASIVGSIVDQ